MSDILRNNNKMSKKSPKKGSNAKQVINNNSINDKNNGKPNARQQQPLVTTDEEVIVSHDMDLMAGDDDDDHTLEANSLNNNINNSYVNIGAFNIDTNTVIIPHNFFDSRHALSSQSSVRPLIVKFEPMGGKNGADNHNQKNKITIIKPKAIEKQQKVAKGNAMVDQKVLSRVKCGKGLTTTTTTTATVGKGAGDQHLNGNSLSSIGVNKVPIHRSLPHTKSRQMLGKKGVQTTTSTTNAMTIQLLQSMDCICIECKTLFASKQALHEHILAQHSAPIRAQPQQHIVITDGIDDEDEEEDQQCGPQTSGQTFRCQWQDCTLDFDSMDAFRQHVDSHVHQVVRVGSPLHTIEVETHLEDGEDDDDDEPDDGIDDERLLLSDDDMSASLVMRKSHNINGTNHTKSAGGDATASSDVYKSH
ncbi:unnamed protein product [Medioppia subpectinata]|uniref:C2H2-type domain-containing protein n=1 Tax=Medioppia subpectinata TaxID=1979941 RepID=A0A7R9PXJ3_9ACAR|nr:unnamed protein product [Medioppia subpectinata]CAG2104864.1 unnamed protein product [Medioppia subpectinata]